jgi:hypothetical protein
MIMPLNKGYIKWLMAKLSDTRVTCTVSYIKKANDIKNTHHRFKHYAHITNNPILLQITAVYEV